MTRVLILGGGGMLGHKVSQGLRARAEVFTTLRRFDGRLRGTGVFDESHVITPVDAWDMETVKAALKKSRPEWVINCIGIIKQLDAAHDPTQTIYTNALFPHLLAPLCRAQGARLVHISTDCVFSGDRGRYTESDVSDASDLYGRTKFLGEVGGPGCVTLRTSIIGRELFSDLSLVDWFLSQRGREIKGFARAVFSGLTTNALARVLGQVMDAAPALEGLYHVSVAPIDKFALLSQIKDAFHADVGIRRDEAVVIDRSLVSDRFWSALGSRPPTWQEMIREMAADPTDYAAFRRLPA